MQLLMQKRNFDSLSVVKKELRTMVNAYSWFTEQEARIPLALSTMTEKARPSQQCPVTELQATRI